MATSPSQALLDIMYEAFQAIKNTGSSYAAGVTIPKKDLSLIAEDAGILPLYQSPNQTSSQDT